MPLHRAVYTSWGVNDFGDWFWTHDPHLQTVQELLACSGIDVNAVTTTVCYLPSSELSRHHSIVAFQNGWSALHYAAVHAWADCVDLLLRANAEMNIQDKVGVAFCSTA
jgi:ankyrin repeat protein